MQAVSRALAGRLAPAPVVVLCFDVEPDDRVLDRGDPGPWPSFEEVARRAGPLRRRLTALSGRPASFSWFVRMDPQVREVWGCAGWGARRYRSELAELERLGDDVGLHTHVWRWDADQGEWLIDFHPDWGLRCLSVALEAFEAELGRPTVVHRAGDRAMNGAMLGRHRGVRFVAATAVAPGTRPGGTGADGPPARSSPARTRRAAAS